jgi:hypothetical protein
MDRLSEERLWNLFTAEVQRLDVDVIALQEVRRASNPVLSAVVWCCCSGVGVGGSWAGAW